jgi:hypothetical protein
MSTKSYTLIPYRLRDHNVQSQTKSFFPPHPRGIVVFWRPKKPFLDVDMGCRTSYSCSYLSRYMCAKSHIPNFIFTKVVEGCQKNYFPQRDMLKFTYKGRFLTIKIAGSLGVNVRTPIPWVYANFYTMYYWMILTPIH